MPSRDPIVVAMSGGVDSSAAAALLVEQGHQVIGVTLKLYNASGTAASLGGRCCSPRDIEDARATAAALGFPHYVLDRVEAFEAAVVDDFVDAHRRGHTPNPCVRCNERIKFGPLLDFARAVGAGRLATGHYARLEHEPDGLRLSRAVDRAKDQSYFLFGVRTDVLAAVQFPLGDMHKDDVRALARRAGLPNADKPDSQQLCFVPDGDHRGFVERRGGAGKPGVVLDEQGRAIGTHQGTHHFTIGQRKGVPAVAGGVRRFVVRIDVDTGTVHTGPREMIGRADVRVGSVRWWAGTPPAGSVRASVQIRHHSDAHSASLRPTPDGVDVTFDEPVEGVAPGQAAVFYDGDRVIGGGWIERDEAAPGALVPASALRLRPSV